MKLNNKGWGLSFLIIIGVIFLLILIFISLRIRSMTHQMKDDDKKNTKTSEKTKVDASLYKSLEERLKKSGETYIVVEPNVIDSINNYLVVSFNTLKEKGYIESLADPSGNGNCNGYVLIKNDETVQPFVKCESYETLNYDLWEE